MTADTADKVIAALSMLGLIVMAGCSTFEQGSVYGDPLNQVRSMQYAKPINCQSGVYTVELVFTTPKEAQRQCGGRAMACYRGGVLPKIVTAHPRSWNDSVALATIGHEVCHLAGATHE